MPEAFSKKEVKADCICLLATKLRTLTALWCIDGASKLLEVVSSAGYNSIDQSAISALQRRA